MVTVIVPAFNERETIGNVIERIPYPTIVVDDASTDDTATIARDRGVQVITQPSNQGYEAAIQAGLTEADDDCITLDADGEHDPAEIERLLQVDADIVVGRRPLIPRKGERILSACCRELFGFEDPLCGFRLLKREVCRRLSFPGNDYGLGFLIRAYREGYCIKNLKLERSARREQPRVGDTQEIDRRLMQLTKEVLGDELER